MRFTNISDSDTFKSKISTFSVKDGHPTFEDKMTEFNAKQFVEELIKHKYRDGWSLPAMP
jgi:hypothetical protein